METAIYPMAVKEEVLRESCTTRNIKDEPQEPHYAKISETLQLKPIAEEVKLIDIKKEASFHTFCENYTCTNVKKDVKVEKKPVSNNIYDENKFSAQNDFSKLMPAVTNAIGEVKKKLYCKGEPCFESFSNNNDNNCNNYNSQDIESQVLNYGQSVTVKTASRLGNTHEYTAVKVEYVQGIERKSITKQCYVKLEKIDSSRVRRICSLKQEFPLSKGCENTEEIRVKQDNLQCSSECNMPNRSAETQLRKRNQNQELVRPEVCEDCYTCQQCGKVFENKIMFKKHLKTHTKNKLFFCSLCNMKFQRKTTLTNHAKRHHLYDKPNMCYECGKSFTNKGDLRKHITIHTNERPFVCKECGKAFKQNSHLLTHGFTHSKEKPFLCQLCGKGYSEKGKLTLHIRKHERNYPYDCDFCGKGFPEKGKLSIHIASHVRRIAYYVMKQKK